MNICLSGGAKGSDQFWGDCAIAAGHELVHWVFKGFNTSTINYFSILDDEKLKAADNYLQLANKSLKRRWPTSNAFANNLLRRNYYQVNWTDRVYAISSFSNDKSLLKINGGTAWACQMYADRWIYNNNNISECELYVFDQITSKWYKWTQEWEEIDSPPKPHGVYAGIGTRELTDKGRLAIRNLYL